MLDNAAAFAAKGVRCFTWVESRPQEARGLLAALAARAAVVVTDEYPASFLPAMVDAAGARLDVRLEAVDDNGVLPLRAADRAFPVAHAFRRHMHKIVLHHLDRAGEAPLDGYDLGYAPLDEAILRRWPGVAPTPVELVGLPLDPLPAAAEIGGPNAASRGLRAFLDRRLDRYHTERSDPDSDASSGLSAWLHAGHLSAREVVADVLARASFRPEGVQRAAVGKREGFWGLDPATEAFLDELITWRELGYGFCYHRPTDYSRFESLPDWALDTLHRHAQDKRPHIYTPEQLDRGHTHDPLWNAAQRQLREAGRIHNYMRMLWGKKVLEWSPTPKEALETLIDLNNRYALDGRDPNSYSGIFWTFGRFDRAWGPERPIFGTVRYMSSDNTAKKLDLKAWLRRWGGGETGRR
jgi:deoxyribodipyrimidine photo-lyase